MYSVFISVFYISKILRNTISMTKIKKVAQNDYISKTKIPTSDYAINPYVQCPRICAYCHAEFMKKFTNRCKS